MATAVLTAGSAILFIKKLLHHIRSPGHSHGLTGPSKDLHKLGAGGVSDFDFERDASHEGFVDQLFGLKVGGEEDDLFERDGDLLAGWEREIVDTTFERNDPTIEEFGGFDALSSEVVDEQATTVAFHLEGSFAGIAARIVTDFEIVEGEFATDDHGWTADTDPTAVEFMGRHDLVLRIGVDRGVVVGRIEELDDIPIIDDGMWDPDISASAGGEAFCEGGFAVSRRTVEKDPGVAVDGGTEQIEPAFFEGNFANGFEKIFAGDGGKVGRLGFDAENVIHDRNRGGTGIAASFLMGQRPFLTMFGEAIVVVVERC